jgi:hypothetical protein
MQEKTDLVLLPLHIDLILNYTECKNQEIQTRKGSKCLLCLQKINFTAHTAINFCIRISKILLLWKGILPTVQCYKEELNFLQPAGLLILHYEKLRFNKVWWYLSPAVIVGPTAASSTVTNCLCQYTVHPHSSGTINTIKKQQHWVVNNWWRINIGWENVSSSHI